MEAELFASSVSQWAYARNLIEGSNPEAQFVKLMEESTELYDALRCDDMEEIKDGIGDCEVVLRVIESQLGLSFKEWKFIDEESRSCFGFDAYLSGIGRLIGRLVAGRSTMFSGEAIADCRSCLKRIAVMRGLSIGECRAHAWEEIKDRKGTMVDGVFVKEARAQ